MLRYSSQRRRDGRDLAASKTNRSFFSAVAKDTRPGERVPAVLLVGGSDHASLTVRHAQSVLRLDRLPSYWSHAAVLLDWRGAVGGAVGVEASLDPEDPASQVPERNGVTLFHLERYLDPKRWPNVALVTVEPRARESGEVSGRVADALGSVREAALNPNRDRPRYPFWDWIGRWRLHVHAAGVDPNPVAEGLPLPGAALVEWLFDVAGLDVTPGATGPEACPETLWSTFLYWHGGLEASGVRVRLWRCVRDGGASRSTLSSSLEREFRRATVRAGRKKN